MLDELWSCQYAAPGMLTASGSSVISFGTAPSPLTGFTHGVHFRTGSADQATAFLRSPRVAGLLTPAAPLPHPEVDPATGPPPPAPPCARTGVLAFQSAVESEVEALFRRGPDFEQGYDLILILAATGTVMPDVPAIEQFLSRLAALAQSALAGAVQASAGPLLSLDGFRGTARDLGHALQGSASGCYALMARFQASEQLDAFCTSPPVQALRQQRQVLVAMEAAGKVGKPQLPLCAVAELVMRVGLDEDADDTDMNDDAND